MKAWPGNAPWGLDYQRKTVPSAVVLENYSRLRRANDLLIVSPDDEFYSSTLDLPKLRFVYLGTLDPTKTSDFFDWLGVNLSTHDLCNLPALLPVYEQRLAAWRFPNTKGLGALISGEDSTDVSEMVRCSPDRDFFLPDNLRELALEAGSGTHIAEQSHAGRFFLLSRNSTRRPDDAHATGAIAQAKGPSD